MAEIGYVGFAITAIKEIIEIYNIIEDIHNAPIAIQDLTRELQLSQTTINDAKNLAKDLKDEDVKAQPLLANYIDLMNDISGQYKKISERIQHYKHKAKRLGWLWYRSSINGEIEKLQKYHEHFKEMVQLLSSRDIRDVKNNLLPKLDLAIAHVESELHQDMNERTFQYLMDKLSSTSSNVNRSRLCSLYEKSPPDWIFNTKAFRSWVDVTSDSRWLWAVGEAGTGKTITACYIADQLQVFPPSYELAEAVLGLGKSGIEDPERLDNRGDIFRPARIDTATSAYFFSYKAQTSIDPDTIMRSLARQILDRIHEETPILAYERMILVQDLFKENSASKDRVDSKKLLEILLDDVARPYIVLDALDEYPGNWQELLNQFNGITSQFKVIVTSRGGHDDSIRKEALRRGEEVLSIGENDDLIRVSVLSQFESIASEDPTSRFAKSPLKDAVKDPHRRGQMTETIRQRADHNFLCSSLHIEALADAETSEELQRRLLNLPSGLNSMLKEVISRIESQDDKAEIGRQALQWTIYSQREMRLDELQQALAIVQYPERESLKDRLDEFSESTILISTRRFLTVDKGVFHIHKSVRDFCADPAIERKHFPVCHQQIAMACLRYSDPHNFRGHCDSEKTWHDRAKKFTLLEYAITHWGFHLNKIKNPMAVNDKRFLFKLLKNDKFLEMSCAALHDQLRDIEVWSSESGWDVLKWNPGKTLPISAVHLLAYFDLGDILEEWIGEAKIGSNFDIDARTTLNPMGKQGSTSLRIACRMGNINAARVLLEHNADPLKESGFRQFSLAAAAYRGHSKIVALLLDIDPDMARKLLTTSNHADVQPLLDSIASGNEDTVAALLEKIEEFSDAKTIINHQAQDLTALQEAARRNLGRIVFRIGKVGGAEVVNQKTKHWQDSAVHIAAHGRLEALNALLYDLNADPNQRQKQGKTPLQLAVEDEHAKTGAVASALVDFLRTDLETLDNDGKTTLHLNAENGRVLHIDTIMRRTPRSHLTRRHTNGQTPIIAALRSRKGNFTAYVSHMLMILKPEEIFLDDAREIYRESLKLADTYWLEKLLEKVKDATETLPSKPSHILHDIIETSSTSLLKTVCNRLKIQPEILEARGRSGQTPLVHAASLANLEMVKLLVELGASKNAQDETGRMSLHWAVDNNNDALVEFLLSAKIDYNLKDHTNMKALQRISADSAIRNTRGAREAQFGLDSTSILEREALHCHQIGPKYVTGDENTRQWLLKDEKDIQADNAHVESVRYLISDPIPQRAKMPLSRIEVRILGCDQGGSDHLKAHPGDRGKNFNGSNTWYDLALLRGDRIIHQYEFSRNLIGAEPKWYSSSWHLIQGHDNTGTHDGGVSKWTREQDKEEARRFLRVARHGDRIVVMARTRWQGWICQVFEADVRVFYRDWEKHVNV